MKRIFMAIVLIVAMTTISEAQTSICGLPSGTSSGTDYVPINYVGCGAGTTHKVTTTQLVTAGGTGVFAPIANPIPSATICTNQAITSIGTTGAGVCASISEAFLSLSNNTTGNATIARHGFLPILDNTATHFLDGTGAWSDASIPATTCTNQAITALTTAGAGSCNSITEDYLSLSAVTTGNASTSKHGFLKQLDNTATNFMNGQGNWAVPATTYPGSGIAVSTGSAWDTSLGKGTFTDAKWCSYATVGGLSCTQNPPGAGADTNVQYNDGGSALGGDANFTWNKTTQQLKIIGKNAGSSSAPLLVNPGASFTGRLIDLQLNNVTKFYVDATTYAAFGVPVYVNGGSLFLPGAVNSGLQVASAFPLPIMNQMGNIASPDADGLVLIGKGATTTTPTIYTNTSGTYPFLKINPVYNQASGTAANTDLLITRTETAIGSGLQKIIELQIGTNPIFNITNKGHVNTDDAAGSTTYPALSSCGTNPALTAGSTDFAGIVTLGTSAGTPSVCTVTFGTAYVATPACVVTVVGSTDAYLRISAQSNTAITVTASGSVDLSGKIFNYICIGQNGG